MNLRFSLHPLDECMVARIDLLVLTFSGGWLPVPIPPTAKVSNRPIADI
jgi:hypothetical protein